MTLVAVNRVLRNRGDTGLPHDPATYVRFAKRFADYAALMERLFDFDDPDARIGRSDGRWC